MNDSIGHSIMGAVPWRTDSRGVRLGLRRLSIRTYASVPLFFRKHINLRSLSSTSLEIQFSTLDGSHDAFHSALFHRNRRTMYDDVPYGTSVLWRPC